MTPPSAVAFGPDDAIRPVLRPTRLAAVRATGLLDTNAEPAFDRITDLARTLLTTPFAFVTIVDDTRSFWKSCVGVVATDPADRQNSVGDSFCQYVVDSDEPLFVGDARLDAVTCNNPSIVTMGVRAWAGYPLRSIAGEVLGTFCVVDTATRVWTDGELETLGALAVAAESEIRLRTLLDESIAHAEATRHEMVLRERLATLAEHLTAADTVDAVAATITHLGHGLLGSSLVTLGILDANRRQLGIRGRISEHEALRNRDATILLTEDLPIIDAIRRAEPIYLSSIVEIEDRYPHVVGDARALELEAIASVPLQHSDGTMLGALSIGWSGPVDFSANDRSLLRTVSLMCAQSLQRAQLGDLRRQFVESLQRELLPELPPVLGWDIAARYLPATAGIGFGGDWYDLVELDGGLAVIVVGDIAGHGIEAAARMSQVRGAINALTRIHGGDLATVLDEAERILSHLDDSYIATVMLVLLDPSSDTISYVSAGHPPAVLAHADGTISLLEDGRRPLLGSGRGRCAVGTASAAPGSMVIAFTDGLVERRDQSPDVGTARVADRTRREIARSNAAGPSVEHLADRIIEDLVGARFATDDVALVVIKHRSTARPT
ncbi:MAG: SpoIIE family protein phosphatase [Ilumatobacteraceae bacterium]